MFAFLTRARPWRGSMRGSRTACGRQCVDASSAHLTQWSCRRSFKTFSRERCAASGTPITLIQWRTEHFHPGDSSGRRTRTRQNFTADRLTGDAPETALLSQGRRDRGRGVRLRSAPGSGPPTLQAPAARSRALRAPALTGRTGRHKTQRSGPRSSSSLRSRRSSSSLRSRRSSSSLRSRRSSSSLRSRRSSGRSDSSGAGEIL